jgi:hypothetical protein
MKNILLSSLVASLLVTGCVAQTVTLKNESVKKVNTTAVKHATEDARHKTNEVKLVQEAIDSLKYAHNALAALENNNKKEASKYLEKALGKLEVTLASKNVPKLLPVDSVIAVDEFIGSSETIENMVKLAKKLLDDDKVQAAKEILAPLKSEIGITVINLPLATYPDALKETAKLVHDNKVKDAKVILDTALNTLVKTETIIPIPLIKATDLIAAASIEKDIDKAKIYLDAAQEELKIAKSLGYVSKSDVSYKTLDDAIDELKSDIRSKEVKTLFTNLQTKIKDFTSKIFTSKDKSKK